MDDETSNTMNLDLNLGPGPDVSGLELVSVLDDPANVADWVSIRDTFRLQRRHRWRWRELQQVDRQDISLELDHLIVDPNITTAATTTVNLLHTGEGSHAPIGRISDAIKTGDNKIIDLGDEELVQKGDDEKGNSEAVSFFDCNICMDLSKDPVVTCCGHLFCWPCIYRWLHVHSEAKECPVCKGQVTIKTVTPIYGRGNLVKIEAEIDPSLKIPLRPQAQRVESLRQSLHRNAFAFPMEEMIRRLGHRFDLVRDFATPQEPENRDNPSERSNAFLNRIMTSRGMRREHQNGIVPHEDVIDLTRTAATSPEPMERIRIPPLLHRRSQLRRTDTLASISSAFSSAEGQVDAYLRHHPIPNGRNYQDQPQPQPGDDRDSYSSIAAVMNSDSQTADNAIEIDSLVSMSTSSSRRRNDTSIDSGDSRAPRRRRLN